MIPPFLKEKTSPVNSGCMEWKIPISISNHLRITLHLETGALPPLADRSVPLHSSLLYRGQYYMVPSTK